MEPAWYALAMAELVAMTLSTGLIMLISAATHIPQLAAGTERSARGCTNSCMQALTLAHGKKRTLHWPTPQIVIQTK